jgi:hypothetical protein
MTKAMPEQRVGVERLRVASPCPASWGTMRGDERTRFCEQCQRHVYNISAMTRRNAQGEFRFSALAPGRYQLMIEASDFETYVRYEVLLGHGATFQEDVILSYGLIGVIDVIPDPPVTYRGTDTTNVFSGDKVRKLPF